VICSYGADPGKYLVIARGLDILDYPAIPAAADGVPGNPPTACRTGGLAACVRTRSSQAFYTDGKATDVQVGGEVGDEGPQTAVLHGSCRGTEAVPWGVNLTAGQRVLPT
jgi:hypothetical protein